MSDPTPVEIALKLAAMFEELDFKTVRDKVAETEPPAEALTELGSFGDYMESVIDPEIEIDFSAFGASAVTPDAPVQFHGWEGWLKMWRLWFEAWDELEQRVTAEELDEERALLSIDSKAKGRGSGVEIEWSAGAILTVRDGKVTKLDNYLTREDALAAAGKSVP